MTTAQNLDKLNKIDEAEFNDLTGRILHSLLVQKTNKINVIENKDVLLDSFIDFLGKYIESDLIRSDKERNNFLNLIDKLTFQKELIQLRKKELTSSDIKEAGIRLGKKSQSAFRKK